VTEPAMRVAEPRRLVWDLPLRLFHWLLAISIGLLWLTQWFGYERMQNVTLPFYLDWMTLHMWLGYWTLGLIFFRVLWGFVGPRHARFSSFFPWPKRLIAYVRALAFGTESKPVGHNPLGSLMVFLMLALVLVQAVSGLFTTDDALAYGPYNGAGVVSDSTESLLNSLHHSLFNYILAAIALHVLAIIVYAVALKQNLVGPMVHGHKPASLVPETEAISSSQWIHAMVAILIAAAAVYGLLALAPILGS